MIFFVKTTGGPVEKIEIRKRISEHMQGGLTIERVLALEFEDYDTFVSIYSFTPLGVDPVDWVERHVIEFIATWDEVEKISDLYVQKRRS